MLRHFILAAVTVVAATPAYAVPVYFEAVITGRHAGLSGIVSQGDIITGRLDIDATATDLRPGNDQLGLFAAVQKARVEFAGMTFSLVAPGQEARVVNDGANGDIVRYTLDVDDGVPLFSGPALDLGGPAGDFELAFMRINMRGTSATALDNDTLFPLPGLSAFDIATLRLEFEDSVQAFRQITAQLTSVAVPEPGMAGIMGLGLLAAAALKRRHTAPPVTPDLS